MFTVDWAELSLQGSIVISLVGQRLIAVRLFSSRSHDSRLVRP